MRRDSNVWCIGVSHKADAVPQKPSLQATSGACDMSAAAAILLCMALHPGLSET